MTSDEFARLDGKRVVVTGASSGIGYSVARQLAAAGGHVLLHASRPRDSFTARVTELADSGLTVDALCCDFQDEQATAGFAEQVWQRLGRVDVLVNNAGVDLLTGAAREWSYEQKLARLFEIDVRSTMLISRGVGARMRDAGSGTIINVGWDQADRGMEGDSGELFSAAKNAIMGATRSLALSLAPHVRVNCVAPGWIRTAWGRQASDVWQQRVLDETPLKRWGEPEDIAAMVRFLASDVASYITGQVINVNGGAIR